MTTGRHDQEQIIAEARYFVDPQGPGDSAEYAITVDDRWQRRGLGERAMHALTATAAHAGLRWLHGDVLAHNQAMLALMRHCRFCCTPDHEDDGIVHAEISLNANTVRTEAALLARLRRWLPWRYKARQSTVHQDSHYA